MTIKALRILFVMVFSFSFFSTAGELTAAYCHHHKIHQDAPNLPPARTAVDESQPLVQPDASAVVLPHYQMDAGQPQLSETFLQGQRGYGFPTPLAGFVGPQGN